MELFFLILLIVLMAGALGSGYPVAFALPGASIITLVLAGLTGYLITGDQGAYFSQGDAWTWLSSGNANLRGTYWVPERDTLMLFHCLFLWVLCCSAQRLLKIYY